MKIQPVVCDSSELSCIYYYHALFIDTCTSCAKKQMIANLMAALRIAQADIASYTYVVNDHYVKVKRDPHRPSSKARFNRRSPTYTGIPDPATSSTSTVTPSSGPPPLASSSTTMHTSYAAAAASQGVQPQSTPQELVLEPPPCYSSPGKP